MKNIPLLPSHPLADRARFELFLTVFVRNPQTPARRLSARKR